jgi:hypothetical protein
MTKLRTRWLGVICLVAVLGPSSLAAQDAPEAAVEWSLDRLGLGFCVDFLMDSTEAGKQIRKRNKAFAAVPARSYARLHPALRGLIDRRDEYAHWVPSTQCFIGADTLRVGARATSYDDPDVKVMVGFWGIAARPHDDPMSDSVMLAPFLFTNHHRVDRNSQVEGLEVETLEDGWKDDETPGDRVYQIRVKNSDIRWVGHPSGDPFEGEPVRWTLAVRGTRSSEWLVEIDLRPEERQYVVGALQVLGKDDLSKALQGSPMRMVGPAFRGGSGTFRFYP